MTVTTQAPASPRPLTVPAVPGRSRTTPDAKTIPAQGASPAPPAASSRPRRAVSLAPMRQAAAKSMTAFALQVMRSHPDSIAHEHVRDAARMLQAGNEEAAQRHLRAAAHALTPQSLHRRGVHDDDGHIAGAQAIDGLNRHVLLVKDIADAAAQNQAAIERDSYGDDATAPPRRDPNAGYGPGANAQRPTARQPPGDRALNAPNRTSAGRPDPNVASPDSPQPRGSKQFARSWDEIRAVIDLATVNVRPYKRTVQTRNGPRVEVVGASARQTAAKAAADEEEEDAAAGSPRGWIPQEKWIQGQKEWIARGEEARRRMTDQQLAKALRRHADNPRRSQNVIDELDRRDEEDKNTRLRALYAEQPKTEADRSRVYQGLVNEGENPEDAWAHAHGTNPEAMQKQAVIADLRAKGHKGAGFDSLTRDAFKDEVRRRIISAEAATNGYMLSPEGKQAGIDPWTLFTGPESRARKYASPELKEWWDQNGRPTAADFQANLMGKKAGAGRRDFYASVTWDDVGRVIEMSARTPMLESTPAPYGVPGGPGLYNVKDNKHSDYLENVVQALMHKRGMSKEQASAVAWAALRRWEAKSRHPEVRAAAAGGLEQEAQAAARARAAHAHSVTWDDLGAVLDLAVVDVKTYQRTVNTKNGPVTQVVTTHDQNYKAGMGQPAPSGSGGAQQGQQNGKAPYQQLPSKSAEKARLLATAKSYRQRAGLLGVEVAAMNSALYNALYGSNTTKAQAGSTTAAQTGSTTAAQKGSTTTATTAATTAAQAAGTTATVGSTGTTAATTGTTAASTGTTAAQAGATTAAQAGSTTAAQTGSTTKAASPSAAQAAATSALNAGATQAQVTQAKAQATKAAAGMSAPQLRTAIGQLQTRITWYNMQATALTAQAAKLP